MKFRDTRTTRFVRGLGAAVAATALLAVAPVAASASVSPFFEATGSLLESRSNAAAAPLPGGKALVAGGFRYSSPKDKFGSSLMSAEVYDPASGEFTATGSMALRRMDAAAAPLPGGKVLVAGGRNGEGAPFATAEIYDPETGEFSATGSMAVGRSGLIAAPLPGGDVLVAGGVSKSNVRLASAEIYDPGTGEFSSTGSMGTARQAAAGAALGDGRILVAGGFSGTEFLAGAEVYDPVKGTWSGTGSLPAAMFGQGAPLADGTAVVFGVTPGPAFERSVEEYDPASGTFTAAPVSPLGHHALAVAPLPGGRLLVAGGTTGAGNFAAITAEASLFVSAPSATSPGVDFGAVEVSTPSAVEALTVTNDGAQTLEFEAAASLSGPNAADFAIVADGCATAVLAFGESCTVEVQVEPSALGPRSASVQLPNNSATGLQEFTLKAEGV